MAIDLSTLPAREALTAIYIGYYDRAADPAGLAFWEDVVGEDGFNLTSITTLFAAASETQALFPFFADTSSTTPTAFITSLYLNLFNRTPDDAGRDFWVEQLQNSVDGVEGAQTVGQIITSIIEGAQAPDDAIITNKIAVALDWTDSAPADLAFDLDGASGDSARAVIDGVDETQATVDAAMAATDAFFFVAPVTNEIFMEEGISQVVSGTSGNDVIYAEDGALNSGDRIDGGSGTDTLVVFNESNGVAVSPNVKGVEAVVVTNQANDLTAQADNNVGGYSEDDATVEVDVEIDAGRMVGVQRWEDFDSRADLVIEDARDDDDTDGTFTADLTVAMVSTDSGNVDYAVYFDDPTNTSVTNSSLFVEVIDQENAATFAPGTVTGNTVGVLTESRLESFSFTVNGTEVTIELPDDATVYGPTATYQSLATAIQTALDNDAELQALGQTLTATLLDQRFDEAASLDNANASPGAVVFGLQIEITAAAGVDLVATNTDSSAVDPNTDIAARVTSATVQTSQLVSLNVELDDVGKGSTGGDALFGAMSTGRQTGDDGTSDSSGIQQFDIAVDRGSKLQTINSTNNALEVVNITNREQTGINNTTTASDEASGNLVVRGVANPGTVVGEELLDGTAPITDEDTAIAASTFGFVSPILDEDGLVIGYNDVSANGPSGVATDSPMPGAVPQHNAYGFSDVRVINAAAMIGAADLTLELTEEIVEKYLDIQDNGSDGQTDDGIVPFNYTFGSNDDEFFVNLSSDALDAAGTGSREDFNMNIDGGAGNDAITTNVGQSLKVIDEQGEDRYIMATTSTMDDWYANSVFDTASTFAVDGGAGDDIIWTNGWGDFTIADGAGADAVYTDNSGVADLSLLMTNIDRNLNEHDQIDYALGSAWAFNAEGALPTATTASTLSGATNESIVLGSAAGATSLVNGSATITVAFNTSDGATADALTTSTDLDLAATATIPVSQMAISGGNVVITEQAYNQAIKNAINTDPSLNKILEAVDGPGNSLIVYSKIDGDHAATQLDVAINSFQFNNGTSTTVNVQPAGYVVGTDVEFQGYSIDSVAESDNTINVAADGANDVFVLSTNDGTTVASAGLDGAVDDANTDLDGSSNETLVFVEGNFGSDTVLNFDAVAAAAGNGHDVLSFNAINFGGAADFNTGTETNNDIDVIAETAGNDTAGEVATLYAGLAAGDKAIAIVYDVDDNNTGTVYLLTGAGTGTTDASVSVQGDIELIGTSWAAMTADNFA